MFPFKYFKCQLAEERRQAREKANREKLAEKEKRAEMVGENFFLLTIKLFPETFKPIIDGKNEQRKRRELRWWGKKNSFLLTIKLFPETFKSIINGK